MVAASLGGVKAKNTIDYKKKVSYYGKISSKSTQIFSNDSILKGWYFPNWEDDEIWKKQYGRLSGSVGYSANIKKKYTTPQSFRDYCFEEAKKATNLEGCPSNEGWCTTCGREKAWDRK
ncbi:hypothetical protein A6V39_01710 [Candidatus Mycoplasma haematobovis]|uniref:Uncharacterized protein n=1 Tax=Candidatus Mycoplasma haematobovis TaxID=432608 RepID=A0A1A9QG89_9MOLU|nr:hypothetical protein [Candidatus Mycoplasma haematobovis]OAL10759.1 hypothetical protein A6V39_01710 [Candidatus Mycoplasma haematobovis]